LVHFCRIWSYLDLFYLNFLGAKTCLVLFLLAATGSILIRSDLIWNSNLRLFLVFTPGLLSILRFWSAALRFLISQFLYGLAKSGPFVFPTLPANISVTHLHFFAPPLKIIAIKFSRFLLLRSIRFVCHLVSFVFEAGIPLLRILLIIFHSPTAPQTKSGRFLHLVRPINIPRARLCSAKKSLYSTCCEFKIVRSTLSSPSLGQPKWPKWISTAMNSIRAANYFMMRAYKINQRPEIHQHLQIFVFYFI